MEKSGTGFRLKPLGTKENYNALKNFISNEICGETYVWTDEIREVYKNMFLYFHGDPETNYNLNKGIALIGKFGVGKTTIFANFHRFLCHAYPFNVNLFRISSIEEILDSLTSHNWSNEIYGNNIKSNARSGMVKSPIHLLINEFGHQYDAKSYGTNVNEQIEMFMMVRYDIFQAFGKVVHITSNYDATAFRKQLHPRLYDRFKEMFNVVELKGNSFRR